MKPLWLRALSGGWLLIALTALVAVVAAATMSVLAPDRYRASATLIVAPDPTLTEPNDIVRAFESLVSAGVVSNHAEILLSESVLDEASAVLELTEGAREAYEIDVAVLPESTVLEVIVRGPDAATAAGLANRVAIAGAERFETLYRIFRVDTLQEAAVPTERDAPRPIRDIGLALVLGSVLGAGIVVLREQYRVTGSWRALAAPADPPTTTPNREPTDPDADRPRLRH
jgi:polysaccharide biosynthesis transport protein